MPALRFKTCRLLSGNVWNRKLTIIQRRILGRLRNKKRSIKRKIYSRKNLNSYIQLQTTRKLSLFYTEVRMGRGKGNPISGRRYLNRSSDWRKEFISIIILITIYHFFFFLASLDFNLFFEGVQSKLARKKKKW